MFRHHSVVAKHVPTLLLGPSTFGGHMALPERRLGSHKYLGANVVSFLVLHYPSLIMREVHLAKRDGC